jgi:protein-tyrosine-phosphatase
LAGEAEMIFCMTAAVRKAVVEMLPAFEGKTYCLSNEVDIDDPIGKGMAAYVNCARQIQSLVKMRFDELKIVARA